MILITDRHRVKDIIDIVGKCLYAGLGCVMLREKDLPGGRMLDMAAKLRKMTAARGAKFIVNDRVDVALAVNADAVHLGQKSFRPDDISAIIHRGMIVGVSAHDVDEAMEAERKGADYITASPVFQTTSKPGAETLGVEGLEKIIGRVGIPVYALGGINKENATAIADSGAGGAAVISAILENSRPEEAVAELTRSLERAIK